ncbi:MAG: chemotaxis protein CheB [Pseudomonadota bacterium]
MGKNIRLLIVDDSRMMRNVIADLFGTDPHIEVIATASSGLEALEIIQSEQPDVITLDINMPEMDGLTTLKHLMIQAPTPTVMLSSLSRDGAKITFDALRYGAVDFITKPSHLNPEKMQDHAESMIHTIKCAASVEMDIVHYIRPESNIVGEPHNQDASYQLIVAMGAAEGGYSSLLNILPRLSANNPLVYLVVLYGTPRYIDSFVAYLDSHCALTIKRANHGEVVQGGTCYIATGEEYMTLHDNGFERTLQIHQAPFSSQSSAINRLMFSLSDITDIQKIGIVLSGSNNDGSEGLEELKRIGSDLIVQDPKNCLHKIMSDSAINHCVIDKVFSAAEIADHLNSYLD